MFVDNLWLDGHLLLLKDRLANPLLVVLELLLLVLDLVADVMYTRSRCTEGSQ